MGRFHMGAEGCFVGKGFVENHPIGFFQILMRLIAQATFFLQSRFN